MVLMAIVWQDDICNGKRLFVRHAPHKTKMVNAKQIHYCMEARTAQIVSVADSGPVAYSYVGGGVEWQPPATYALVSRDLPLHIADRYVALVTFLAGGILRKEMFVRKNNSRPTTRLTESEKVCKET